MTHVHEYEIADDDDYQEEFDSYSKRQEKPLTEQSLDDFDDFFQRCKGVTFVFLAYGNSDSSGQVNTLYPDAISAICLADCALRGDAYAPSESADGLQDFNEGSSLEIVSAIRNRIAEMNRREVEFNLIWHLAGNDEVHVDCSGDYMDWGRLNDFFADEVRDYFREWLAVLTSALSLLLLSNRSNVRIRQLETFAPFLGVQNE